MRSMQRRASGVSRLRKLLRLLGYVRPYWLQAITSVILMAAVGLLDAFRLLLVGPIFDRVLNPNAPERKILSSVPASA